MNKIYYSERALDDLFITYRMPDPENPACNECYKIATICGKEFRYDPDNGMYCYYEIITWASQARAKWEARHASR